ncbi:hypothetical protein DLM_2673 [Aquitalea magnusonii]|uniref:Phage tail assembly protein n=1 Tax=Aquitalea magnusonii TaxID=332411 RepID=A0A3G9GFX9_9NEIS|nr:hypothetical protein [Aquitalea magnusonii]BBF86274.1 hypothetical protein DLM_2673 [Aquitalea magnusonii]
MDEKKALLYGVEYPARSGQLHYDFELRLPTVGDNIAAIEAHGIGSNMRINTAMLASCLVKLGDIPAEAITYELLEQQMVDDDYDVLAAERDRLKKKRMRPNPSSAVSDSPSSPSASMASPSPESAS